MWLGNSSSASPWFFWFISLLTVGSIICHPYCELMGIARLSCNSIKVNIYYGVIVPPFSTCLDVVLVIISYALVLCAVFRIPSHEAPPKALSFCGSPVSVILLFSTPALLFHSLLTNSRTTTYHFMYIFLQSLCGGTTHTQPHNLWC